ncbi:helix-turn-helix transcriptional regulator [Glycomyces luteolus]|uniref:Helix-turn-helix transcriptional regulator n=1 Tax=Glycomyces luteolus TaxID=2670330 RepID=A0A9X3P9Z7_9ACTN|nr:helix-turn-helix transcriptional regulator [Glycomyces luteolus]MDA1358624.1 helix-turn-helix transcriptional regulator [Glycomyces luteolus]
MTATTPTADAAGDATPAEPPHLAERRRELADFVRSRRERLTPEVVGLPPGRRRRTPGLRREEVAQLASVGVSWYTWLEQARDITVSPQVLDAIARALRLDAPERSHLFGLAGAVDPAPRPTGVEVPQSLRAVLRQVEPFPASIQNCRYDLLQYNRTFSRLFTDLDALPPRDRNCMWLAFMDPGWKHALVERRETLELMVANFRRFGTAHYEETHWRQLVDRLLAASPEFREIWDRRNVADKVQEIKLFRNRDVGLVRLHADRLWTQPGWGMRLTVFSPADDETAEKLERLRRLAG